MEDFRIISNYKDSDELRLSFNNLANRTFGIDFEQWYQKGLWNDTYICYSYANGNTVVSNVSITKLELIVDGERKKALQIGTVMTHPDHRNRGLSKNLMNHVLSQYEKAYDLIFLFANKEVVNFYPKFGFKAIRESRFTVEIGIGNFTYNNIRKLNISNNTDLNIIVRLANERIPVSSRFGVGGIQSGIIGWYCLNVFTQDVYYFEDLDAIVIFKLIEDKLHLFDVIAKKQVHLQEVLSRIALDHVQQLIFHFTPDFPDVSPICTESESEDVLFIKTKFMTMPTCFKYPITAKA